MRDADATGAGGSAAAPAYACLIALALTMGAEGVFVVRIEGLLREMGLVNIYMLLQEVGDRMPLLMDCVRLSEEEEAAA